MSRASVVVVTSLLALSLASSLQAQSLAEAAATEAARRGTPKPVDAKKTFTNKDLVAVAAPSTAVTETPAFTAGMAELAAVKPDGVRTPAYWQARLAAHGPRLARATRGLQFANDTYSRAVVLWNSMETSYGMGIARISLQRAQTDLDEAMAEAKAAEAAIEDVREEARRLGVLPGWLR